MNMRNRRRLLARSHRRASRMPRIIAHGTAWIHNCFCGSDGTAHGALCVPSCRGKAIS